jgi:hypothetical protein
MLLIYTTKYDKCLGSERKEISTYKLKDPLSFEIWIVRTCQLNRDDDCGIFVTMISTKEQRSIVCVALAAAAELCPENHCTEHKL